VTKKTNACQKRSPPLWTSQGTWARSNVEKAHALSKHLAEVFQQHLSENEPEEEEGLIQLLSIPLPTQSTNQMLQRSCSSRSHQKYKS
jgi:hypothetical protein